MCVMNVRTYLNYAKQQKANGSEGWGQSLETAKTMLAMAAEIKREMDADKTADYQMAA